MCVNPFKISNHHVPSKVADHIVRLNDGGDWSLENGQGLCTPCHNRKTRLEDMGKL